jgi:membrane-associated phospholipid phosphatase
MWISENHFRSYDTFNYLSHIPEIFLAVVPIIYFIIVIKFSLNRWSFIDQHLLMFANGIAITQFFKVFFKFLFGRYWPETWRDNNPSLINDNQYGFHPFHKGVSYESFPSGHAATLLAAITILWFIYPPLRWLYTLVTLAGIIGVLGMNFNFVSDILAGGILGYVIARYTIAISCRDQVLSKQFIIKYAKD